MSDLSEYILDFKTIIVLNDENEGSPKNRSARYTNPIGKLRPIEPNVKK